MIRRVKNSTNLIKYAAMACVICASFFVSACGSEGDKLYGQSVKKLEEGSYEEARELIMRAIEADGSRDEYHICYGMVLISLDDSEGAREQFLSVITDKDNRGARETNKRAYRGIALSYYEDGVYEQAKAYFELALKSKVLPGMDNDLVAYRADCEMFLGDYDKAVKLFSEIIDSRKSSDDELVRYYISRANAYMIKGNYTAASEDYCSAINIDGYCYQAYIGRYLALVGMHDVNAAESVLDEAAGLECRNSQDEYYNAVLDFYKGNTAEAMDMLVASRNNGVCEAEYYIGRINQQEGKYEEALKNYETYIAGAPYGRNADYCNQVAGCYMELEDYAGAKKWIEEGIGIAGGSMKQELEKNRITIYEKLGNFKKAKQYVQDYISEYEDADMLDEFEYIKTRCRD